MHEVKTKRGCMIGKQYVYYKAHWKTLNLLIKIGLALISKWYAKKRSVQESLN
jgi:hypothetical protein